MFLSLNDELEGLGRRSLRRRLKKIVRAPLRIVKKVAAIHRKAIKKTLRFAKRNIGAIAAIAAFIPFLAPAAAYLKTAAAARQLAVTRKNAKAAKRADAEIRQEEERAVADMVAGGLDRADAVQVMRLVGNGVDPERALKTVIGDRALPKVKPVEVLPPEQAQAAFMAWLRGWRPDIAARVTGAPASVSQSMPAGRVSDDTGKWKFGDVTPPGGLGEIDWSAIGDKILSVAGTVTSVGAKLADLKAQREMIKAQLDRARNGLAPLPTAQVEQQAQRTVAAQAGMAPSGGMMPMVLILAAVAGGFFLFAKRR